MNGKTITLDPGQSLAEALSQLNARSLREAPIVQDGAVLGVLRSSADGVDSVLDPADSRDRWSPDLSLAKKIQRKLLPRAVPTVPGLRIYGTLLPAAEVGGDYWSSKYYEEDDCATLKLADVTGHGVAAAILVPAVKFISGGFYRGAPNPRWVIEHTNHVLVKETPVEIMVSMVYGWYSTRSRRLTLVNAGHQPVFLIQNGKLIDVPPTGPLLGLVEVEYNSLDYVMAPGDVFFTCSDGITEARVGDSRFGEDRVREIVLSHAHEPPQSIAAAVLAECQIAGGQPNDDRSILIAKGEEIGVGGG